MARGAWLLATLCLLLALPGTASAAPRLCDAQDSGGFGSAANQPRPNGVEAAYLFAKLDGQHWTEPANVCVAVTFFDQNPATPYLQVHLWSTSGFYFDLSTAGIPGGTPITLGLKFPSAVKPVTAMGQWRDGLVGFGADTLAVQARTAPWTYVPSAYNSDQTSGSGTIDCTQGSTTWSSTFGGFVGMRSGAADDPLTGSFFEANSSNLPFPYVTRDGGGSDVRVDVEGCGDSDPSTVDGHFAGFLAPPALAYLGLSGRARDAGSSFLSSLVRIRDAFGGDLIGESLRVTHAGDFAFDPIDGVTFPPLPTGADPIGLSVRADFNYSKHRLALRARKANVRLYNQCLRSRGKVVKRGVTLACRRVRRR